MADVFKDGLLHGQHALITGGGSGINRRIAERFAAQGAAVSIVGRSLERAEGAATAIRAVGGQAQGFSADVRDFDALASAFSQAHAAFGPVDICIAGAAGNFVAEAANMSSNGFRTVVDIDLVGTWNTFRAVLALLREGRSNLLAVSAVQSVMPMATQAHVCAAKAGIDMLVRTLSIEWAQRGVRCNAIAPGPEADTEGMRRLAPTADALERAVSTVPLLRMGSTDDVAHMALFLSSELASYVTGAIIPVDGGAALRGGRDMRASYVPRSAA